jgi:hypothetical protein
LISIHQVTSWRRVLITRHFPYFPSLSSYLLTPPRQPYTSRESLELGMGEEKAKLASVRCVQNLPPPLVYIGVAPGVYGRENSGGFNNCH